MLRDEVLEFNLIKHLKEPSTPLFLEELEGLSMDYNTELDNETEEILTKYVFEDDEDDSNTKEKNVESQVIRLVLRF